jgi:hypothetical protein
VCHQLVGWLGGIGLVLSLIAHDFHFIRCILTDLLGCAIALRAICHVLRPAAPRRRSRKQRASGKKKR